MMAWPSPGTIESIVGASGAPGVTATASEAILCASALTAMSEIR